MYFKVILAIYFMTTLATATPTAFVVPNQDPEWIDSDWRPDDVIYPWTPEFPSSWSPWAMILCYTYGSACNDCNSKFICQRNGVHLESCNDPLLPYCFLGECYDTPFGKCAPQNIVPYATTEEVITQSTTEGIVPLTTEAVPESTTQEIVPLTTAEAIQTTTIDITTDATTEFVDEVTPVAITN